jgi:hypothetical protein
MKLYIIIIREVTQMIQNEDLKFDYEGYSWEEKVSRCSKAVEVSQEEVSNLALIERQLQEGRYAAGSALEASMEFLEHFVARVSSARREEAGVFPSSNVDRQLSRAISLERRLAEIAGV